MRKKEHNISGVHLVLLYIFTDPLIYVRQLVCVLLKFNFFPSHISLQYTMEEYSPFLMPNSLQHLGLGLGQEKPSFSNGVFKFQLHEKNLAFKTPKIGTYIYYMFVKMQAFLCQILGVVKQVLQNSKPDFFWHSFHFHAVRRKYLGLQG